MPDDHRAAPILLRRAQAAPGGVLGHDDSSAVDAACGLAGHPLDIGSRRTGAAR